jgi:hypothetical protein
VSAQLVQALVLALVLLAGLLAIVRVVQSKATDLGAWAILALSVAVLLLVLA